MRNSKKKLIKHIVQYTVLAVLAGLFSTGIIWANYKASNDVCHNVIVEIMNADSTTFVTRKGIHQKLEQLGIHPEGVKLSSIDTQAIENALNKSEYLESAECIIQSNNDMLIQVRQLVPVMRVFDRNESYYVNIDGKRMKATAKYHIDVPVVEGHFTKNFTPQYMLPLLEYVSKNKNLKELVTMYSVRDSNNIYIVPCIYGHIVNIGNNKNLENKFAKLKQFYTNVLPVKGWTTYDTISVKWNHQIVATRRNNKIRTEVAYNPDEDEQAPDLSTIQVDGNSIKKNDPDAGIDNIPSKKQTEKKESAKAVENKKSEKVESKSAKSSEKKESSDSSKSDKKKSSTDSKVEKAFASKTDKSSASSKKSSSSSQKDDSSSKKSSSESKKQNKKQ